jgi:hypothetical protein
MIRRVRYAVLAFVVLGALSIGVAVDWSTPNQAPVPVIELRSGASPDASKEPSSPTLKAPHSGRNLIRIRLPKIQRPRPARTEPREYTPARASGSAVATEPDSGADSDASGARTTANQDDDQAAGGNRPKSPVQPATPGTPEATAGGAAAVPPPLPAPAGESTSDDWGDDDDDDDGDDEEGGDGGDDDGGDDD